MVKKEFYYFILLLGLGTCAYFWVSLQEQNQYKDYSSASLKIVATTGMIGDVVKQIVQDRANVAILMQAGVDPHSYKASVKDAWQLNQADIIFFNGLHLEGGLHENLYALAQYKNVYAVSDSLPTELILKDPDFPVGDPHIWFDVAIWIKVTQYIADKLQQHDPENAAFYADNAARYVARLASLDAEIKIAFSAIPLNKRIIITSHDAFSYFARAYGVTFMFLRGVSTVSEPSIQQRIKIRNFMLDNDLHALYLEFSVNTKDIEAIKEDCERLGHPVVCYELYSDTLGEEGTAEGTYIGTLRYNLHMMIKGFYYEKE